MVIASLEVRRPYCKTQPYHRHGSSRRRTQDVTTHLNKAAKSTPRLVALRLMIGHIPVSEDEVAFLALVEPLAARVIVATSPDHSQDTA